jgi:hypothetical protein
MQTVEKKINVQGTMKKMQSGETLVLNRKKYRLQTVRITASIMKSSDDLLFSVNLKGDDIVVTKL